MATVIRDIFAFTSGLNVERFHDEMFNTSFSSTPTVYQYVTNQLNGTDVEIEFTVAPNATDLATMDAVIAAHPGTDLGLQTAEQIVLGSQGGDLAGVLPNADVRALSDNALLSHPITSLTEGEFLTVSGGNITTAVPAAGGTDEQVKVTVNDTTEGYLNDKLTAAVSSAVTLTEINDGGDEDLEIGLTYGTPVDIGSANNAGSTDTQVARVDHVHAHGSQGGGSQHLAATQSLAGFMSAVDKLKLDNLGAASSVAVFDHFISSNTDTDEIGALGWRLSSTGAGSDLDVTAVGGHPGIIVLSSGTASAGRVAIHLGGDTQPGTMIVGGASDIAFEALIHYETSIGVTDLEMTQIGLGVEVGDVGELLNGVYVRFNPAVSNAFTLVSASSGVRTEATGTTTVLIHTWYRVGFVISDPGGTPSIQMYINGTAEGSAITTNIPTVALAPMAKIDGAGGAVSPQLYVDYFELTQNNDLED